MIESLLIMAERIWRPTASKTLKAPGVMWNKLTLEVATYQDNITAPHQLVATLDTGRQLPLLAEFQDNVYYAMVCRGMNHVPWSKERAVADEELAQILGAQIVLPKAKVPLWPKPIEYITIMWPSPYFDPRLPRFKRSEAECIAGILIESDTQPNGGIDLISRKKGYYATHGLYGFVSCATVTQNCNMQFSLEKIKEATQ